MGMKQLIDQIKAIDFKTEKNFDFNFDKELEVILPFIKQENYSLLKQDFDFFLKKGRFLVINTFGGGILFLKVVEKIDKIQIDYSDSSNAIIASVTFLSKSRKKENVKYKPNAGQTESIIWKMESIFPHFSKYQSQIKSALILILGKLVKHICEHGRKNWAYMKIENEFEIQLSINNTLDNTLIVKIL
jgi:hypothetical protein